MGNNEKAYKVVWDDLEFREPMVRAKSAGNAKEIAMGLDGFEDVSFTEIRAYRVPWADQLDDIDVNDYPVMWEMLKHGEELNLGDGWYNFYVDESNIPMFEAYGGLEKFVDFVYNKEGKVMYGYDKILDIWDKHKRVATSKELLEKGGNNYAN